MNNKRGKVYNRIFTTEKWNLVNNENKDVMEDFLEEYTQRQKKKSTLVQYRNDIRIILIYILEKCGNKSILELRKKDFRRLNIYLSQEKGMSNARVNRLMSATHSLLTYCEDDDEYDYDINVSLKVKGLPKKPVRVDEDDFFFSFDQFIAVRDELIKRKEYKLAALHSLLFDSGGRRNEIFQINKENILDGNKTNIVVGKRGKLFVLVYLNDTKDIIKQYLDDRGNDDIPNLWIIGKGENKKPATYEDIYLWVVKISKLFSEIEHKNIQIFPHSYRHARAECLLQGEDSRLKDKDGNNKKFTLEQVQAFLHHSDPSTTLSYAKDHSEDIVDNMFGIE